MESNTRDDDSYWSHVHGIIPIPIPTHSQSNIFQFCPSISLPIFLPILVPIISNNYN